MAEDVLAALATSRALAGIIVVTVDEAAAALAARYSARVLADGARDGQTGAVAAAARHLAREGKRAMLTIPGDVPLVTPDEIGQIIAVHNRVPDFVIVPAHDERGSNAILCAPPDAVPLKFGDDSFLPHLDAARRAKLEPTILRLPGLGLDIDNPADLAAFVRISSKTRARALLEEIEVGLIPPLKGEGAERSEAGGVQNKTKTPPPGALRAPPSPFGGGIKRVSIAVIGGGIGGLAAAASLREAGFDVHVYEQAKALGEVGAGINIGPNASRLLHSLGLAEKLGACGVKPRTFDQRRWDDGRFLLRSPLGGLIEEKFGAPYYTFHRADLHGALAGLLPTERVHLGHRFKQLTDRGDRIEAQFENGTAISADVLIGADGIHSAVRHALLGPEKPRFTGCVAYRGLVPAERLAHLGLERTTTIWMGPARHFVHYFVSAGRMVNFVAVTEEDSWQRESWVDRGEVADALVAFAGWHPQVRAIIGATDETYKWALFDRVPLPRWSAGRVTLLGDACHPMLPFMGQGAAQAIEDAATLTACLSRHEDVPAALKLYERLRLPRASRLQAMSETNKTRFHLPDGPAQQARDAEMARGSTDWSLAAIAWLYAHDASVVDEAAEPAPAAPVVKPHARR
jgi:salicylate hydroxylase